MTLKASLVQGIDAVIHGVSQPSIQSLGKVTNTQATVGRFMAENGLSPNLSDTLVPDFLEIPETKPVRDDVEVIEKFFQ